MPSGGAIVDRAEPTFLGAQAVSVPLQGTWTGAQVQVYCSAVGAIQAVRTVTVQAIRLGTLNGT